MKIKKDIYSYFFRQNDDLYLIELDKDLMVVKEYLITEDIEGIPPKYLNIVDNSIYAYSEESKTLLSFEIKDSGVEVENIYSVNSNSKFENRGYIEGIYVDEKHIYYIEQISSGKSSGYRRFQTNLSGSWEKELGIPMSYLKDGEIIYLDNKEKWIEGEKQYDWHDLPISTELTKEHNGYLYAISSENGGEQCIVKFKSNKFDKDQDIYEVVLKGNFYPLSFHNDNLILWNADDDLLYEYSKSNLKKNY